MRKNRIIASLMALLMALSTFSGLCFPVSASESDDDVVWTGLGFYVTANEPNSEMAYTLHITDNEMFLEDEEGSGIYTTADGLHTVSIYKYTIVTEKLNDQGEVIGTVVTKVDYLKILNNATKASYYITDFDEGLVLYESAEGKKDKEEYYQIPYDCYLDKLFTMDMMLENETHMLFVQKYTGELACYDKKSGQILFTNPYDVSTVDSKSATVYEQLISQIIIEYADNTNATKTMNSYAEAALSNQITVKEIKGGIRVEYILGRQEANYLVPKMISATRFEEQILSLINEAYDKNEAGEMVKRAFSGLYEQIDPKNQPKQVADGLIARYPISEENKYYDNGGIYVLVGDASSREIATLEEYIKTYCPDYTYDELEADHNEMGYSEVQKAPPNFKMAIEYTLNENGFSARLPANGIRYDATNYTLQSISMLPYIGAGSAENTGYIFLPDGSGSITRFEAYVGKNINVSGSLYGMDYAYHTITGRLQETMRFPVFGIAENATVTDKIVEKADILPSEDESLPENDNTANEAIDETDETEQPSDENDSNVTSTEKVESRGFLAIIEEGDAMVSIMSTSGGGVNKYYYNVKTSFSPRQRDEYRLADSVSVGTTSAVIVESKRKYVGSLTLRYIMLTDSAIAEEKQLTNTYEPTWVGMATAYREYLTANGILNKLTEEEIKEQLPLYIETFGTVETTEKIASVPVTVDKALTSFEEVKTMYNELSESGITNINFKLKGYYNGGMKSSVPYKLKWQEAAGGEEGFNDLVAYANEKGFGVYPDFDFAYAEGDYSFDGFSLSEHAVKTIDDRYSSRIMYSAATQDYDIKGGICISPSAFLYLFEGLDSRYSEYKNSNISVSTLGYALNSDFNEDDAYSREDSKTATAEALSAISSKYENVMSEGGNAYAIKYIDHLLDASLDSSRYALTSASVPFVGTVLHGSLNFAGQPINMEGDTDYAFLKAVENGASLYFILSYNKDNTSLLKEDKTLSQYYSIRYDIWKEDLIDIYSRLNSTLGDLQNQFIVDHVFLDGKRVPDADEAEEDAKKSAADELKHQQEVSSKVYSVISTKLNVLALDSSIDLDYGYTLENLTEDELEALYIRLSLLSNDTVYVNGTVSTNGQGEKVITYESDDFVITVKADNTVKVSLTENGIALVQDELQRLETEGGSVEGFDKYAAKFGTIAKVVYENGATFILNYNDFDVTCESDGVEYTVSGYSFVAIKDANVYNYNSSGSSVSFRPAGSSVDKTTVAVGESAKLS